MQPKARMKARISLLALAGAMAGVLGTVSTAGHAGIASFDDFVAQPALNDVSDLYLANGSSNLYAGVDWGAGFAVVGDQYRTDTGTPGPLFGLPHSGHYFLTNRGIGGANDGMTIATSQVLTGAWFGRNEYYGFGAGADQVTIYALQGAAILASVVFDLPAPAVAGQPGALAFVDTSGFLALQGITGYRIDRRELGQQSGNWVADDFNFVAAAAVPEPQTAGLLLAGLGLLGVARLRRRQHTTRVQ